jgi:hypothetical protein
MMLAVGAYSGPRPVCGAVAQLAKSARHVVAAIERSQTGVLGWLGFMEFGWFTWIGSELTKNSHKPSVDAYRTFDLYISGALLL